MKVTDGGLHFGFLDATVGLFLDCLEKIGDTNVIASPRLMCLNKQRAEIQIGEELGYVSTTVTGKLLNANHQFPVGGHAARMRPYIGNDGLIRLRFIPNSRRQRAGGARSVAAAKGGHSSHDERPLP